MIKTFSIQNNNQNYVLFFCDVYGLIDFFKIDPKIISSFENLMKIHRTDENYKYSKIFQEDISMYQLHKLNLLYQFIYNPDNYEVITVGRVIVETNECEFGMIHTNQNYRGLKFCQTNIKWFMKNILKIQKNTIRKFVLTVRKTNTPAIKCYENCGFIINPTPTDDKFSKEHYLMENII